MIAREELHELIDRLPETELPAVRSYLRYLADVSTDPVLRAVLNVPLYDEPETEKEPKEDLAAGRVVSTEVLRREFGLRAGRSSGPRRPGMIRAGWTAGWPRG